MGRTFIFYAIAAAGLLIVAMNADSIEGRQSQASMTETLLVVGGVLVLLISRDGTHLLYVHGGGEAGPLWEESGMRGVGVGEDGGGYGVGSRRAAEVSSACFPTVSAAGRSGR